MRLLYVIILIVTASAAPARGQGDPEDMLECIEQIMAWKMSEQAKMSVAMIAGMRLGGGIWSYHKDESSGIYFNSYTSAKCKSPDSDPAITEREDNEYRYRLDGEILRLRDLADFDGSGFVSTDEGMRFRQLVEFGCKAAHIAVEEKGDLAAIRLGLSVELGGSEEGAFENKVKEYNELRLEAEKAGISGFPSIVLN